MFFTDQNRTLGTRFLLALCPASLLKTRASLLPNFHSSLQPLVSNSRTFLGIGLPPSRMQKNEHASANFSLTKSIPQHLAQISSNIIPGCGTLIILAATSPTFVRRANRTPAVRANRDQGAAKSLAL